MGRALILIAVVWTVSCKSAPPELPLSDDVLIDVLVDLHLAEGAMQRVPAQWRDSIGAELRARVALTYGMTPDELERVVGLLQLQPERSVVVYDSVIARLEREQSNLQ